GSWRRAKLYEVDTALRQSRARLRLSARKPRADGLCVAVGGRGRQCLFLARDPGFAQKRRHDLSSVLPELFGLRPGSHSGGAVSAESRAAPDSAEKFRFGGRAETGPVRGVALPIVHALSRRATSRRPHGGVLGGRLH